MIKTYCQYSTVVNDHRDNGILYNQAAISGGDDYREVSWVLVDSGINELDLNTKVQGARGSEHHLNVDRNVVLLSNSTALNGFHIDSGIFSQVPRNDTIADGGIRSISGHCLVSINRFHLNHVNVSDIDNS